MDFSTGFAKGPSEASPLDTVDLTNINLEASAAAATPWYFRLPRYKDRFRTIHNNAIRYYQHTLGRQLREDELVASNTVVVDSIRAAYRTQAITTALLASMPIWALYKLQRSGAPTRFMKYTGQRAMLSRFGLGTGIVYVTVMPVAKMMAAAVALMNVQEGVKTAPQLQQLSEALSADRTASTQQLKERLQAIRRQDSNGVQHTNPENGRQIDRREGEISKAQDNHDPPNSGSRLDTVDLSHVDFKAFARNSSLTGTEGNVELRVRRLVGLIWQQQHVSGRTLSPEEISDFTSAFERAHKSARIVEQSVFLLSIGLSVFIMQKRPIPMTRTPILGLTGNAAWRVRVFGRTTALGFCSLIASEAAQNVVFMQKFHTNCEEYSGLQRLREERTAVFGNAPVNWSNVKIGQDQGKAPIMQQHTRVQPNQIEQHDDTSPASSMEDGWETSRTAPEPQTPISREAITPYQESAERAQESSAPLDDFWDEASPTQPPSPGTRQSPSEDSWDRIRRQAAERRRDGKSRRGLEQGQQEMSDMSGDSFTFTSSDAEKELARDEAQKDFDARLERERQGRDFDGQSRGSRGNW